MTEKKVVVVREVTIVTAGQKFRIEMQKRGDYCYVLVLNGLAVAGDIPDRWDAVFGYEALVQAIALRAEL